MLSLPQASYVPENEDGSLVVSPGYLGGGKCSGREAFGTRVVYLIAVTRGWSRKLQTRPLSEQSLVGAS